MCAHCDIIADNIETLKLYIEELEAQLDNAYQQLAYEESTMGLSCLDNGVVEEVEVDSSFFDGTPGGVFDVV